MDRPLSVVASDGSLAWPDRRSMDSDDDPAMILDQVHRWMESPFLPSTSIPSTQAPNMDRAGQLSPISTGMDVLMASEGSCDSARPQSAMAHSASSSSCAESESWGHGHGDSDEHSDGANDVDVNWERGSDGLLTAKPEPIDEDYLCLDEFAEAPLPSAPSGKAVASGLPKLKRPRGRPRKHPLPPNCSANKVTKGRSKTGCITCRKRKKKCDEAKPRCMNCEKNAVVCEGYPEKQIWKSGKEKAEEARIQTNIPTITMQPIFDGLETLEDRIFWKHYNDHLSTVLTVESEHRNAFKELLIPIATRDPGLMHSILSLSSIHLDLDTPYGINILKKHPKTSAEALRERSTHHHTLAMDALRSRHLGSDLSLSAMYGQMLCLILEGVADGRSDSQHRLHLKSYRKLIRESPPQDPAFRLFITEFFQYHIFADELLRLHSEGGWQDDLAPPPPTEDPLEPPRLLGVVDGLFTHLCEITAIRNRIREKIELQADPLVDYPSLYKAEEINQAISEWQPRWPPGDSRERVAPLYKQMMWVYLFRSIYPPAQPATPVSSVKSMASISTGYSTASLPLAGIHHPCALGSTSLVNTPPKSPSVSCSPSPHLRPSSTWPDDQDVPPPHSPRRHTIQHDGSVASTSPTNSSMSFTSAISGSSASSPLIKRSSSMSSSEEVAHSQHNQPQYHRQDFQSLQRPQQPRADSPPPIRGPSQQDPRVTLAVEQSLTIIDSLKPADPAQTLLLIPCLVVGTACFAPAQQDRIRAAVRTVRGYTGLRNADRVLELLEEVWGLMAAGDWLAVWDFQTTGVRMGLDFLCA